MRGPVHRAIGQKAQPPELALMGAPVLREHVCDDGPDWVSTSPGLPLHLRHKHHRDVVEEDLRGLFFERGPDGAERPCVFPWGKRHLGAAKHEAKELGISSVAYRLGLLYAWVRVFMPKGTGLSLSNELFAQVCGTHESSIKRSIHELDGRRALRYAQGGHTGTVAEKPELGKRSWVRRDRQLVSVRALTADLPAKDRRRTWTDAAGTPHTHADIRGVGHATMEGVHALGIRVRVVTGCNGKEPVQRKHSCPHPAWEDLCNRLESARKIVELRLVRFRRNSETPYKLSSPRFLDFPPNLSSKGGVRGGNFVPSGSDPPAQGEGVPVGDAIGRPLGSHEPPPRDTGVTAVGPIGERVALPPGRKNARRANGGNPRAIGTNPRATWDSPRGRQKRAAAMEQHEGFPKSKVLGPCADCGAPAENDCYGTLYCYAHLTAPF